jgi:ubiquinone/menaquinone biosynthesis C-methylase UbiE
LNEFIRAVDKMKHESDHLQMNAEKWDKWAESLDRNSWRSRYLRRAQRGVLALIDIKEKINFLDIGCGTGWAVGQVAALAGNKGSFYGVDLSSKMIEKAKKNFRDNKAVHFIQADVESIPLGSDFFDAIICTNSFHHYLHPDSALKEIHRLLKNGGKLFLLDPTADTWFIKLVDKIGKLVEHEHVKLYKTEEFRRMFTDAGLKYSSSRNPATRQKVHIAEKI